jgi:hypothetical protein
MKCVLLSVLLYFTLIIMLVKTWNLKKIRDINNVKDFETTLIYETHASLRQRYFLGETEKSHYKIQS